MLVTKILIRLREENKRYNWFMFAQSTMYTTFKFTYLNLFFLYRPTRSDMADPRLYASTQGSYEVMQNPSAKRWSDCKAQGTTP